MSFTKQNKTKQEGLQNKNKTISLQTRYVYKTKRKTKCSRLYAISQLFQCFTAMTLSISRIVCVYTR